MKYDRGEKIAALREKAMALPLLPGVYIMRDKAGKVIYVGKAKALKNRVSQYFGSPVGHSEKVRQMVAHVDKFDYILAGSEFEALVLECSLIKQYAPKYNILLKDDKGYHYIRVSPPPFSRISVALQKTEDGARYIGPYMSSYGIKQAVDEANKVSGLSTCSRTLAYGRKPPKTERPCLNYHIGQCCAPCTGKVTEAEYAERVQGAIDLLTRGSGEMMKMLTAEMEAAAERLDFEKAAKLRDRIAAIRRIDQKQKVVMSKVQKQDVIAMVRSGGYCCFEVFCFRNGALTDREEFITEELEAEAADRGEFLQWYYLSHRTVPPQITVDDLPEDAELLEQLLTKEAGRRVHIVRPQKGEQAALVDMCRQNAAQHLADRLGMGGRETAALQELMTLLGLPELPRRIESYDISHTAGEDAVAGMVVFENGKPKKSDYRRFTIKEAKGGDDPAAMTEVLTRRFAEYREHEGEAGFGTLPDLILLDGGEAQVQAVQPVLEAFDIDVPLFGLVKDGHHRTRAVALSGGELQVQSHRAAYSLVSALQEEVHRYAIGFHRQKRSKKISTTLTAIEGVGETRARELLRRFGSVKAVAASTEEELLTVKGMTRPAAKAIIAYFSEK
ncbi:MAG: excinuclease ABC subunit UvrC [Clostridia bacterium]|nr:excinuclease ABC subunit UvrC [Clostridia bacterium]